MGTKRTYNHEFFPAGTRVKVQAPDRCEGSDHDWHGHLGLIVSSNAGWILVRMEKGLRHWPSKDVFICNHNLQRAEPAPFFECPDCGKDIANDKQPHSATCSR